MILKVARAESTFLIQKDVERRKQWLSAIPRAGCIPGPSSAVCAKHFHENDIIRSSICRQSDGTCQVSTQKMLRCPSIQQDMRWHISIWYIVTGTCLKCWGSNWFEDPSELNKFSVEDIVKQWSRRSSLKKKCICRIHGSRGRWQIDPLHTAGS